MKRWIPVTVGIIVALLGAIWALQGVGLLAGSVMTGQPIWIVIGLAAVVGGLALARFGARRPKDAQRD